MEVGKSVATAATCEPAIVARGFSFAYPDAPQPVLGPLDWSVDQGAFVVLVGSTGCGKTTLLRNCKPALAPEGAHTGTLEVLGRAVNSYSAAEGAAAIGYVAQSPENQVVCDTVWHEIAFGLENLGTPQAIMRRRVAEVAHFFGIEPWFRRPVSELSGGQLQIVNLAAVLALQPRVLLLDEPTAQLDPVAEKNFLHLLFRVNRELGITVVVATHAPEAMRNYATEVVGLSCGSLKKCGAKDSGSAQPLKLSPDELHLDRLQGEPASAISLRDVWFRYARDAEWVARGLNLEVRRGSIHAIVGGNGCGKSTLLRLIAGVLKRERGRVSNTLVARQALLPQNPKTLFVCDTVADELREWQASCGYDDVAIEDMLERFSLSARADNHPYDLSGGQQQLLAFAKILLTDPDLLLLDEPTKGLDVPTKRAVANAVVACARAGATIVLVTHDLTFVSRVADTTTMLFDGEATCTEPTDEFFAGNLFYRPVEDEFYRTWQAPVNEAGATNNAPEVTR